MPEWGFGGRQDKLTKPVIKGTEQIVLSSGVLKARYLVQRREDWEALEDMNECDHRHIVCHGPPLFQDRHKQDISEQNLWLDYGPSEQATSSKMIDIWMVSHFVAYQQGSKGATSLAIVPDFPTGKAGPVHRWESIPANNKLPCTVHLIHTLFL
jgi:hypothetical protein